MKKFILITVILLVILFSGVIYLNKVILPTKIKSLIVTALKKQTRKDVTLKSLEFSIFKGLVLHDLVISEAENVILSAREATCAIFILPILKKQIIIPSINLKAPYIFLERRKDFTFNLQDLFSAPGPAVNEPGAKNAAFSVFVYKLNISSGEMVFQDDTLADQFKKEIKNIQFSLRLALPVNVKFNFKAEVPATTTMIINGGGEYKILNKELTGNLSVKNLSPREFAAYYNNLKLDLVSGLVDAQAQVNLKGQLLFVDIAAQGNDLVLTKDKFKLKLDSGVQAKIDYNLQTKKLGFSGNCDIRQADITGLEFLGEVKNLYGKLAFSERSLIAESLKAELLGKQFEIKLGIKDFNTPVLNINTVLDLSFLPAIAKDKFNFSMISSASGKAALSLKLHPDSQGVWGIQGSADITGGGLKLGKQNIPVENISAALEFSQQSVNWSNMKFKYQGIDYQSSGTLSDFVSPGIELKLSSSDLSLAAAFNLAGKQIKLSQLKGKYLDSAFSLEGNIDNSDAAKPRLDLSGKINFALEDLIKILNKQYPAIKAMRPSGHLDTQFSLTGDISDFKNCFIRAKLSSNDFSLYGLNSQDLSLDYLQEQRIIKISSLRIAFYDGAIEGAGSMNLDTVNLPYHLEMQANGVKLEKLKKDTLSRNKDISGTLQAEVKLSGYSNDFDKLTGSGSVQVKEGRLWELNLFQGLGKLLFARDFASIVFSECRAAFSINNKFVYTDNLRLRSNIANLSGPLKIGFDSSLEAALDVEILSELVPLSGTLKDIATVVVGKAGIFGVIKLSGTLQQPKYIFKPAVTNIIKGLTDVLFGRQP
ncbi:AsmA family protein [bacterium]|nr:MAG: AsmA family protein [bacterium]